MATKKTPPKKPVKKAPVKLLRILMRCDEMETLLIKRIMQQTNQKTATKAITEVLLQHETTKARLSDLEKENISLKSEIRNFKRMALQVKEWIAYFKNLTMLELHQDDQDEF